MTAIRGNNRSCKAIRRRRLLVAAHLAVAATVAFASGAAAAVATKASSGPSQISLEPTRSVTCDSPALNGSLPALVYLPAGYWSSRTRYPVVYFLHGLPAGPTAYKPNAFVANALVAAGRHAIVVAPQGARTQNSDHEYLKWDAKEDWPTAIANDLPRCIDKRFRTVRSRFGRALVGVSAGGFGAFNIGLRNLSTFGAVESWSGYFDATDPAGDRVLNLGSARANADARVPYGSGLVREVSAWPSFLAFYVGAQDSRFLNMNKQFDAALNNSGVKHVFSIYPGGHSSTLWASQAPYWLGMALDALSGEAEAARAISQGGAAEGGGAPLPGGPG